MEQDWMLQTQNRLQTQHKLWNVENVIITPHVAGDFHHPATLYRIVDIIAGTCKGIWKENN